jgi:uncharacterized protein DUF6438
MLLWAVFAAAVSASQPVPQPHVMIVLQRTRCFGACPEYTVWIAGDGSVRYEGRSAVAVAGTRTTTISRGAVESLLAAFDRIQFFSLKDRYFGPVTDLPTTYISLTLGERSKMVQDYFGAPKELKELERLIDEIVGTDRWVRHRENSRLLIWDCRMIADF